VNGSDLDAVFAALADPTRRDLLERLGVDGAATATTLSAGLPISRQAVVKHLQVLADAGLVESARAGREVRYAARSEHLGEAAAWLLDTGAAWDRRLQRLRNRLTAR
jgi:DNA-binding transcriptional ArsR family regulator